MHAFSLYQQTMTTQVLVYPAHDLQGLTHSALSLKIAIYEDTKCKIKQKPEHKASIIKEESVQMNTEMQDSRLILLVGQALFWPFIHWASHLAEAKAWAQPLCYSETKKGEMVEFGVDKNKSKHCSEESRSQPGRQRWRLLNGYCNNQHWGLYPEQGGLVWVDETEHSMGN